jgi:hypothetical protein
MDTLLTGGKSSSVSSTVSFHSTRRSRITGGPDDDELWSLSRVTKAVDEYVFLSRFPQKMAPEQYRIRKKNLGGSEAGN